MFENFLNEFPSSAYADKVSSYLVDVYMSTRSYEAALQSIERIKEPNTDILRAKTRILFQLGTQAFANADFAGASARFRQAKKLAPALGSAGQGLRDEACYWEGEAEYRLGHLAQAAAAFDEYLSTTSQRRGEMYALAYYNLGYIAFQQKNYAAAESRFASYVRLETGDNREALADAYNRLGDCCLRVRRFDEAKQYYATAEKLGMPSGDYSYYQQALVAGLQKDYGTKVTLLDELAEKYPDSPYAIDAMYEKGRSFVQSNQRVQAIATFRQLVEQHPESPVSRKAAAEIGLLYYQDNDYAKAIEAYTYVVKRYPGSEEARLAVRDLKSIYVETNRVDQFAQLMAELPGGLRFEAGEQDSLTYVAADRLYMKGDAASAQTSFEQYLQKYPDGAFSLDVHYRLCVLAKQRGDEEGVLSHAGKLLEYPDNPYSEEALLLHAEVLFNRKQYEQALADYRQLQTKATTPERRRLGIVGEMRCAFLLPDQQAAVVDAATRLLAESNLTPELKNEALYDRAKAWLAQNDADKAVPDLEQLATDTRTLQGAEAKYRLAQLLYDKGDYAAAEKEVLDFIEQSTPHAYWLARSFVLLSDVYVAMDKKLDAQTGEAEEKDDPFRVRDIGRILSSGGFWLVALLCVLYYSAIFPFQKYAVNMLQCNLTFTPVEEGSFWATNTVTVIQYIIMLVAAAAAFVSNFSKTRGMRYGMLALAVAALVAFCYMGYMRQSAETVFAVFPLLAVGSPSCCPPSRATPWEGCSWPTSPSWCSGPASRSCPPRCGPACPSWWTRKSSAAPTRSSSGYRTSACGSSRCSSARCSTAPTRSWWPTCKTGSSLPRKPPCPTTTPPPSSCWPAWAWPPSCWASC